MRKLTKKHLFTSLILMLLFSICSYSQTEATVKIESSERIKQLVAKKRAHNKRTTHVKGYKIQLFYGSENGAMKVKENFQSVFPRIPAELKFHSPDWKVWVGSYKTKLEADRALVEVKEGFPSAIIRPAKVKI